MKLKVVNILYYASPMFVVAKFTIIILIIYIVVIVVPSFSINVNIFNGFLVCVCVCVLFGVCVLRARTHCSHLIFYFLLLTQYGIHTLFSANVSFPRRFEP